MRKERRQGRGREEAKEEEAAEEEEEEEEEEEGGTDETQPRWIFRRGIGEL